MAKSTSKKNYISGGAKKVTFGDGGSIINLDLKLEDINNLPVSDKGYIRIVVAERSTTDQYGNTHYVYENQFVPDKSKGKGGAPLPQAAPKGSPSVGRKPAYDPGHPFG